ncbi:MAG: hypothetical protein JRF70_06205 [Deltaproteobacteria bacterium]|jgi:hypothetical protein|nr:hypothetical protein [Deltaproteobacteria bacterium]MBW2372111.1 hypothetical protein [Deltaproteobacteria bacterium]
MRGWILAAAGLAALAAGAYAVLRPPAPGTGEIGDESRAELERVLQESP